MCDLIRGDGVVNKVCDVVSVRAELLLLSLDLFISIWRRNHGYGNRETFAIALYEPCLVQIVRLNLIGLKCRLSKRLHIIGYSAADE